MKKPKYNVISLVARFGGRSHLSQRLNKNNLSDITPWGIDKWMQRESIPLNQLLAIERLSRLEGNPINLADFIIHDQTRKSA